MPVLVIMPLVKSAAKTDVGKNIKTELAAGKNRRQAIAIALSTQRRAGGSNKRGGSKQ